MTSEDEQWSNLRWMHDLLKRPLGMATQTPLRVLASGESDGARFSRRAFFADAGFECDPDVAQMWFDDALFTDRSVQALQSVGLDEHSLVIGYELSPQTKRMLARTGATYIDLWLHPVRFYDDILFAFQSNDPEIHAGIGAFHVPESQFYLYADRIRIQTYKGWHREEAAIPPGSAAFFGQTLKDKSVCDRGRMLSLLDYRQAFEDLGARRTRVFYQRHPYLKRGDEAILRFVTSRPFAEVSAHPTYRMLSSPHLDEVVSISSSVVHEAKYFDKTTRFLFRPIIEFDRPDQPGQFHSVCQDFISPHFWSALLAPVMPVTRCEPILFRDSKDKVRDMLGFYWSYAQVDKAEATRVQLKEVRAAKSNRKGARPAGPGAAKAASIRFEPDLTGFVDSPEDFADLTARIDAAAVVSFDIFDTLLERVVADPADIFLHMGRHVHDRFPNRFSNFIEARKSARALASDRAVGEEVRLEDRYGALAQRFGLGPDDAAWLHRLELSVEDQVLVPRRVGRDAFRHAKAAGKRVILVSDTFFDRAFIELRLQAAGIEGWDALYLSSETGALKQSGTLFAHVLDAERVPPDRILHIGDNPFSDIIRGDQAGLATFELSATPKVAEKLSPLTRIYADIPNREMRSAVCGLVARRIVGAPRAPVPGFTQHSVQTCGYAVLGPLFFGMAAWVLKNAKADGVRDLFFLSRDGEIVKRCYDALAAGDEDAPRSHYVLASRRAIRTAGLFEPADLPALLDTNFTPMPLSALLSNRFGMDAADLGPEFLSRYGFATADECVGLATDRDRLVSLVSDREFATPVLRNAAREREAYLELCANSGLNKTTARTGAVVDIGHLGTLQAGLQKLFQTDELRGYYFATFQDIDRNIPNPETHTRGYYVDRINPARDSHSYPRNILMFEAMFLNAEGSFLKAEKDGDGVRPIFMSTDEEGPRVRFARDCHDAVVAFSQDMKVHFGHLIGRHLLTGNDATSGFRMMLDNPAPADARLFQGLSFENVYSGRSSNQIVSDAADPATSIWTEGARVIWRETNQSRVYGPLRWRRLLTPFVAFFVAHIGSPDAARQYRQDPAFFFTNLSSPRYRRIGKLLYPRAFRI
ncbi:HAD family hydrolase [Thalassococcus sp. BH17M4-6]|uniref:HAD family hydrolase n=1 Tax=Thalassococcus sp. BH17M4-6 TaxID=3413148 RepID=UPI003BD6F29C